MFSTVVRVSFFGWRVVGFFFRGFRSSFGGELMWFSFERGEEFGVLVFGFAFVFLCLIITVGTGFGVSRYGVFFRVVVFSVGLDGCAFVG